MNHREAEELFDLVALTLGQDAAVLKQLGNGRDWVVVIKARTFHLWCLQDWIQYCQVDTSMEIAPEEVLA